MKSYLTGMLFDIDGVIYWGDRLLDGVSELLSWAKSKRIPYLFLSNNSSKTPEQVANKLNSLGLDEEPDKVITSSLVTAHYLKEHAARGARVYVIGEEGLLTAVSQAGFQITDNDPQFVVVGLDRKLTAEKVRIAVLAIRNGALFLGTNADSTLLTNRGLEPGTGSIVTMVEYETKVKPIYMGKPHRRIFEMASQRLGLNFADLIMIGDKIDTDIKGAKSLGITTVLVMTGVTTPEDLKNSDAKPDYIIDNIKQLVSIL